MLHIIPCLINYLHIHVPVIKFKEIYDILYSYYDEVIFYDIL